MTPIATRSSSSPRRALDRTTDWLGASGSLARGEALRALKPQEVRALTLKAQGYSYAEIGEITGWSYTKINRCMAEGRKRFLQVFSDIEQGRRCEQLAGALSELADGESANGSTDAVEFHLRSCATCRAKLRAYRAVPGRVFDLAPAGPVLDQAIGGGPHEWIAERAAAALDKVRETSYSLLARGGGGGSGEATALATAGGTRGAGVAAVAKVLAICGATAAGGATCVATGLVDPGAVGGNAPSNHQRPQVQRPANPAAPPVVAEQPAEQPPAQGPVESDESRAAERRPPSSRRRSSRRPGSSASSRALAPSSSSSSGSSEFGGPPSGGGGASGGGGGSGGGGFGIEG